VGVVMITMEVEEVVIIIHPEARIVLHRVIKMVIGNLIVHIEERINSVPAKRGVQGKCKPIGRKE